MNKALLLLAATLALAPGPRIAAQPAAPRTLAVSGSGELKVPADLATVAVAVVRDVDPGADLLTAKKDVDTRVRRLLDACAAYKVQPVDVDATETQVQPLYDLDDQARTIPVAYEVARELSIRFRDLPKVGSFAEALLRAEGNRLLVRLGSSQEKESLRAAQKLAVDDARKQAEALAAATGTKLGRVLTVALDPVAGQQGAMATMTSLGPDALTSAGGSLTFCARATVVFELAE